jgi:hypothetical protein
VAANGTETLTVEKSHLLLVEGPDDEGFFQGLARNLELQDIIQIINLKGRNNLEGRLKAIVAPNTTQQGEVIEILSLGIVLDGEIDPSGTFQKICTALRVADLAVPAETLLLAGTKPRSVCMILPDTQTAGMLEDLCLKVFEGDMALNCVNEYFLCLDESKALFSEGDLSKAKIRALLSSKPRAETRLGIAAQQGWWPWQHPAFDEVKQFLELLVSS